MRIQYITLALRNVLKNKVFSLINILGLCAGMSVALLIGLWIADELSYDRFHKNLDNLYQLKITDKLNGTYYTYNSMPLALANELRANYPEIQYVAEADWAFEHGLRVGDKRLFKRGYQIAKEFLEMFSFELIAGDLKTALIAPDGIVLTETTARALFGHENYTDMLGLLVKVDNYHDCKVSGIVKDPPENSTLWFHYLLPFSLWERQDWVKNSRSDWKNNSFQIFIALQDGVDPKAFQYKIKDLISNKVENSESQITLHAAAQWRLFSKFENGVPVGGYIEYIRLFGIIGAFVLILACINFMNLSTARSEHRSKEVGIRKVLGSEYGRLVRQFLSEALIMAFLACIVSVIIVELVLPAFNLLTEKKLSVPYADGMFYFYTLGFTALAGILAGSYPAFYLSSFRPIDVLKGGRLGTGKKAALPRKVLVITQFVVSISLIAGTLVVYRQIQYAQERPSGYDPNRLLMVTLTGDLIAQYEPLKHELLRSGLVSDVTKASSPITQVHANMRGVEWKGKNPDSDLLFATMGVSDHYFQTLGIQLSEGRFFSSDFPTDSSAVIFNETAIEKMGLPSPIGEQIRWNDSDLRIVGIVEDVIMTNPYGNIQPAMYVYSLNWNNDMMFRLAPNVNTKEALSKLEAIFQKYNPAYPFQYSFADASYAEKFTRENLLGKLAGIFAFLAIFISCLGLFGLSAYVAERRTREIGIRKVLGATVGQVWYLLSLEFIVLVLISLLLSIPLAMVYVNKWLENYEYRIQVDAWVFVFAGLLAIGITLLTVSFQILRAAFANPVDSLRNE